MRALVKLGMNGVKKMSEWVTLDGGDRVAWGTGSVRDTNKGKRRYDLISLHGLNRLADLMARGAEKYGERNWEGGQSIARSYESALRHLMMWQYDDTEDHLAAVAFNVFSIIHVQEMIKLGLVTPELRLEIDDFKRSLPQPKPEPTFKRIVDMDWPPFMLPEKEQENIAKLEDVTAKLVEADAQDMENIASRWVACPECRSRRVDSFHTNTHHGLRCKDCGFRDERQLPSRRMLGDANQDPYHTPFK
jgi:hypothetical protein